MFSAKTKLEGITCPETKVRLECYQQITIKELPETLMMHLQCIDYDNGANKIVKNFEFSVDLQIEPCEY